MHPRADVRKSLDEQFERLSQKGSSGLGIEGMRLLAHIEKQERLEKDEKNFDCQVVNLRQLDNYINELSKKKPSDTPERIQFLVKNGDHYTAVDFKFSKDGNECIILDAAGSPPWTVVKQKLEEAVLANNKNKNLVDRIYFAHGKTTLDNIQKDEHSCPVFAFDHVSQMSRMNNIYEQMRELSGNTVSRFVSLDWNVMPPQLVWNAQSTTWLDKYKKNYTGDLKAIIPGLDQSFEDYISRSVRMGSYYNRRENKQEETILNHAAMDLFSGYQQAARKFIGDAAPELLQSITGDHVVPGSSAQRVEPVVKKETYDAFPPRPQAQDEKFDGFLPVPPAQGERFDAFPPRPQVQSEGFDAFPPGRPVRESLGAFSMFAQKPVAQQTNSAFVSNITIIVNQDRHWLSGDASKEVVSVMEAMKNIVSLLHQNTQMTATQKDAALSGQLNKIADNFLESIQTKKITLDNSVPANRDFKNFCECIMRFYGDDIKADREFAALTRNLNLIYGPVKVASFTDVISPPPEMRK